MSGSWTNILLTPSLNMVYKNITLGDKQQKEMAISAPLPAVT
jgi:hypothetical protein